LWNEAEGGGTEGGRGKRGYNVEKGEVCLVTIMEEEDGGAFLRIRRNEDFDFTSGCRLLEHQMKLDTDTDETKRRKRMMMTCWKNHHVCQ